MYSLALSDAWGGDYAPSDAALAHLVTSGRDPRDTMGYEVRVQSNGARTPRWLATAKCIVDEQRVAFQWLTNDALRVPVMSVLERGIGDLATDNDEEPAHAWVDLGLRLQRIEVRFDARAQYLASLSYQVDHALPAETLGASGGAVFLVDALFFDDNAARTYSIGWLLPGIAMVVLDDVVRRACAAVPWGTLSTRINA